MTFTPGPLMRKIPQVAQAIQTDQAAQQTSVTQRRSKLTGSTFVQTLVLGWLADPQAGLDQLTSMDARLG